MRITGKVRVLRRMPHRSSAGNHGVKPNALTTRQNLQSAQDNNGEKIMPVVSFWQQCVHGLEKTRGESETQICNQLVS
jgi:hypothetical protein